MQEHRPFLPHGFQFRPSDEELIEHYLKKKVSGIFIPLAEYFIRDCNLYEEKPSEIWDSHGGPFLNADEDLYFFTQLKKKSSKGSRIDRKVGSSGGTWQGEDAGKDIVSGQSKIKIGSKKRLRKNQPSGHDIMKYGSVKKRKLKDFQDNSNQSEQVADIEMDRLFTRQQNQQQNCMDYQEVSCSSSDMMSEQSLAGGMGLASSVYEPSMEMMMSHFDQMICNQQYDSGNNVLQDRETGENYHCHSESIVEVPMAVPESLVQHEDSDGLPELIEEDYSFLEDLLQEPIGDVRGSFGLMLDLDDLLS
ncbi:hypothetical protein KPL70_012243 [Citrus sinensis]|nr:hypothetical protein KPL70_012243 [Citrus sinensis]